MCRRHNIRVIIELHAAPGSQNPNEHSGTRDGSQTWGDSNIAQTVQVIDFLAARYVSNNLLLLRKYCFHVLIMQKLSIELLRLKQMSSRDLRNKIKLNRDMYNTRNHVIQRVKTCVICQYQICKQHKLNLGDSVCTVH